MASSSARSSITNGNAGNDYCPQQVPDASETVERSEADNRQPFCFILTNDVRFVRRNRQQTDQQLLPQQRSSIDDIQSLFNGLKRLPGRVGENDTIDDIFVTTLKQVIHAFMRHTDRPFPLKYVLDLS